MNATKAETVNSQTVNSHLVNKEVTVTGLYFRPTKSDERHLKGYPKRMEYEGREYTFIESGLRYLMRKGQQLVEVFDMTDGTSGYRLKFDASAHEWTLVGVWEGRHAVA